MKSKSKKNDSLWENLSSVLTHEIDIYNDLLKLEEEKAKAVTERHTLHLNQITSRQETLMEKRDAYEQERMATVKELSKKLGVPEIIYLTDLLNQKGIPVEQGKVLFEKTKEFRKVVSKLRSIVQTNRKMLENTYDFFEAIRQALAQDSKANFLYSPDGTNDSNPKSRPIFLDTNC